MTKSENKDVELQEFIGRVVNHLPLKSKDPTLIILKGHLLSEELMNDLISSVLPHPEHIKKSRFNYAQTLSLAKAVSDDEHHDKWVWLGLKKLNEIRNLYGHNLEPKEIEIKESEFISYVEKHSKKAAFKNCTELTSAVLTLIAGLKVVCGGIKNSAK